MKRYVCTAVAGLLLALASTGTATASLLPQPGQDVTQVASFGDQTVGEQTNDADVTQAQGNGNVNVSPAIAVFGDAETTNEQGSDNNATANVDQANSVEQSQSSEQEQSVNQADSCCDGTSQAVQQTVEGGDQSVDEQQNVADVTQKQGNGNVNVSPAIAVFGDAETTNHQGNENDADASVTQSNETTQSQSSTQKHHVEQDGEGCCKQSYDCREYDPCKPRKDYGWEKKERCCEDGRNQGAEQSASFGDQHVGEQRNEADVKQKQGNGNLNISAIALGGDYGDRCGGSCKSPWKPAAANAETTNAQGNGNEANADVDQRNAVEQTQTSYQRQSVVEMCEGLVYR